MTKMSALQDFVERRRRLFVLTGCSAPSGIPDTRDAKGSSKRGARPGADQAFAPAASLRSLPSTSSVRLSRQGSAACPSVAERFGRD